MVEAGAEEAKSPLTRGRSRARRLLLQALYQWLIAGHEPVEIEDQFRANRDLEGADLSYFHDLLHAIPAQVKELDQALDPWLDRPLAQLDPVERATLWIGAYELLNRRDIPYRVTINEAVILSKAFGAEQAHRYVNGVLDKLARQTRVGE
jgi:N utilization substance protein B